MADRRRCGEDLHLRERCLWAKPHPGKKKPPSKQGGFSLPAPATSWSRQPTRTTSRSSAAGPRSPSPGGPIRSEEHTSELQSLMRISYAVFCLKKKTKHQDKSTFSKSIFTTPSLRYFASPRH